MSETATGWQPIETAPRDGRTLLLWVPRLEMVIFGRWSVELDGWKQWLSYFEITEPTHWMLIEPPLTRGRDE